MNALNTPAGAMPVAASAMLVQSYPTGPWFSAYRLPFPGSIGARDAGVCFEGEGGDAGANPGGAPPTNPPAGSPPANPATPPTPPATGAGDDADGLGDKGKKALNEERTARREADERARIATEELEALKAANATEAERAVTEAKKAGTDEAKSKYEPMIRNSAVRAALMGAGITPSVMDLAAKADEFGKLKVTADGEVEGLTEAVAAFKAARKDLFTKASGDGTADGGAGSSKPANPDDLEALVTAHYEGKA